MKKKTKKSELDHFTNLASEWWNPNGKFKILHTLSPIRMQYIIKQVCKKQTNDKISNKNLNNLDILDLGCGGGILCEPMARLGANVTGVDYVKQNIIIAKKHAKDSKLKIQYLCKDLEDMKLKQRYDIILILEVLEHIDNWKKIIINTNKLLKPGGKIIICLVRTNVLYPRFLQFLLRKKY